MHETDTIEHLNIEPAKKIRGWMSDHELAYLAMLASRATSIVEVGSAYGRSTHAMAFNMMGLVKLYAVDTWNGSEDELDTNHVDFAHLDGDFAYHQFCHNLWVQIVSGSVIPLRMHSKHAAALLRCHHVSPELVFIDASHTEADVLQDISVWSPLIRSGGIICGHDYHGNNIHWPGVTAAVDKMYPDAKNPVGTIWIKQL